jgi:hypothetical protein
VGFEDLAVVIMKIVVFCKSHVFAHKCTYYAAVSIATGYELGGRGVVLGILVRVRFSSLHVVQTGSDVHPITYLMGTGGNAAEREADHFRLVPRSRIRGSIHSLSHAFS